MCQRDHPEDVMDCPNHDPGEEITILDYSLEELRNKGILDTELKNKVLELLQCPINWSEIASGHPIVDSLTNYWKEVAVECLSDLVKEKSESMGEMIGTYNDEIFDPEKIYIESFVDYFGPSAMLLEDDDLEKEFPLIEEWIEKSRMEYRRRVYRFEKMRMLTTQQQQKHFIPYNLSDNAIREKTRKGNQVSLFYKSITPEKLEQFIWLVLDETWRLLLNAKYEKLYVDVIKIIGASKGKDTSYICFKLDLNTPSAHAHPIIKEDIPPDQSISIWDNLQ
jgi:hypothetical protein